MGRGREGADGGGGGGWCLCSSWINYTQLEGRVKDVPRLTLYVLE